MEYPRLIDRVKAMMADTFIIVVFMFIISAIFNKIDHVPDEIRISAFVVIFFLYDPILVSLTGATLGHHSMKLRVQRDATGKNLNFLLALLRFVVKSLLGWISFLTISFNDQSKAIHDMAVGSTVIYKDNKN